jgi:hypothetical protein
MNSPRFYIVHQKHYSEIIILSLDNYCKDKLICVGSYKLLSNNLWSTYTYEFMKDYWQQR